MSFQLPFTDEEPRDLVSTKCPTCKIPTEQEYHKVAPIATEPMDPIEHMKLIKRLVICTQCGNMRLIN